MVTLTGFGYNDFNNNSIVDKGEADTDIAISTATYGVRVGDTGIYRMVLNVGVNALVYEGGALKGPISVAITMGQTDGTLDIVNGRTIVTSQSITVGGQIAEIQGRGSENLILTGDYREQKISGSSGNDILSGNGGNDILVGNLGNDVLNGGGGIDVAVFSGVRSQFAIASSAAGFTVSGNSQGTDTLTGVELFRFDDGDYYFDTAAGGLKAFQTTTSNEPGAVIPTQVYNSEDWIFVQGHATQGGQPIQGLRIVDGGIGTASKADGSFAIPLRSGAKTLEFKDGNLPSPIVVETFLAKDPLSIDIIDQTTLLTSGSIKVSGEVYKLQGTGSAGLTLIGDYRSQEIVGTSGNDTLAGGEGGDLLVGGFGNDRLVGGAGIDTAVFQGAANQFTITQSSGAIVVTGNGQGSDSTWGVEVFRFDNGEYHYSTISGTLVPFGENPGPPLVPTVPNNAPSAAKTQTVTTSASTAVTIAVNATDADGDTITYTPTNPSHGALTGTAGNYVYTPLAAFQGTDQFSVVISDGKGGTATQAVTINVLEANEAPAVLSSQVARTTVNQPVTIVIEATDPDGDALTFETKNSTNGVATVGQNGIATFTPKAGFIGNGNFAVTIDDGNGNTSTLTVTVKVYEGTSQMLASQGPEFDLSTTNGFKGTIGGSGNVFGTDALQHVIVADFADNLQFDPSFNKGGDIIEFLRPAQGYLIELLGSIIIVRDGDSQYRIPVGQGISYLKFADGTRTLRLDQVANEVKLGNQTIEADAALISAPAETVSLPNGTNANARSELIMQNNGNALVNGKFTIVGTSGAQDLHFRSGQIDLDPSFNKGGDTIHFAKSAAEFSAYVSGTTITLVSGSDNVTIPVGPIGITLDFQGEELVARVDLETNEIKIGDTIITNEELPIGAGISLDIGSASAPAVINLLPGTAYTLLEDPDLASYVTINGFDSDDKIVILDGQPSGYNYGSSSIGQSLSNINISSNDGRVLNSIELTGIEANGFVYDASSALLALGWNFIVAG